MERERTMGSSRSPSRRPAAVCVEQRHPTPPSRVRTRLQGCLDVSATSDAAFADPTAHTGVAGANSSPGASGRTARGASCASPAPPAASAACPSSASPRAQIQRSRSVIAGVNSVHSSAAGSGAHSPLSPVPGGRSPLSPVPGGTSPLSPVPGGRSPLSPVPGGRRDEQQRASLAGVVAAQLGAAAAATSPGTPTQPNLRPASPSRLTGSQHWQQQQLQQQLQQQQQQQQRLHSHQQVHRPQSPSSKYASPSAAALSPTGAAGRSGSPLKGLSLRRALSYTPSAAPPGTRTSTVAALSHAALAAGEQGAGALSGGAQGCRELSGSGGPAGVGGGGVGSGVPCGGSAWLPTTPEHPPRSPRIPHSASSSTSGYITLAAPPPALQQQSAAVGRGEDRRDSGEEQGAALDAVPACRNRAAAAAWASPPATPSGPAAPSPNLRAKLSSMSASSPSAPPVHATSPTGHTAGGPRSPVPPRHPACGPLSPTPSASPFAGALARQADRPGSPAGGGARHSAAQLLALQHQDSFTLHHLPAQQQRAQLEHLTRGSSAVNLLRPHVGPSAFPGSGPAPAAAAGAGAGVPTHAWPGGAAPAAAGGAAAGAWAAGQGRVPPANGVVPQSQQHQHHQHQQHQQQQPAQPKQQPMLQHLAPAAAAAAAAAAAPSPPLRRAHSTLDAGALAKPAHGAGKGVLLAMGVNAPPAMAREQWSLDDYELLKQLYRGTYSSVHKALCKHSSRMVVCKVYDTTRMTDLARNHVQREVKLHSSMAHPNILNLFAAFAQGNHVVLIEEVAEGGDLYLVLKHIPGHRLPEDRAVAGVVAPLLRSLAYIHERGVVHRDIKLENVLFSDRHHTQLLLADFGISLNVREERAVTRAGTSEYMAPEQLRCPFKRNPAENKEREDLAYGAGVDVWALGVLAYEILHGRPPFLGANREETERIVLEPSSAVSVAQQFSSHARDFILSCLQRSPGDRPTCLQLLQHPWVRLYGNNRLVGGAGRQA